MSDIGNLSEDDTLLAAELALGLLDGEAAREALSRQARDAAFAGEVALWQRLSDRWLSHIPADASVPDLFARIEQRLDAPGSLPKRQPETRWKTWAVTSMAASAILAVALGLSLLAAGPTAPPASFVGGLTQINDAAGAPLLSALYDRKSGTLSLRVSEVAEGGKVPELWVIPEGGAPRSLGLIGGDSLTIELSAELRALLVDGATMAITLEPVEGAPHAAPTGEILGTGRLQSIEDGSVS